MDSTLVVGSKDCSVQHIALILNKDSAVVENWSGFAKYLGISSYRIKKLRDDLLLDRITYSDVVFYILEDWVAQYGKSATLPSILEILEDKLGAHNVGESLRLRFNLPCKVTEDSTAVEWENISSQFQERVAEHLKSFFPDFDLTDCLPMLNGPTLTKLMSGQMPQLFKETLPQPLSYYIGRTIIARNIISIDIFQENDIPDVFLFRGMERYELSMRAKDKITGNSKEQIRTNISARFMILDQANHFDKICGMTPQPVHVLRRESDGRLRWIRSRGSMGNLQKCVHYHQDQMNELTFCQNVNLHANSVCIADSPGMGKSVLLSRIGRTLRELNPDKAVFFIIMSEFIRHIKLTDATEGLINVISHSLKIMVCENVLGETVLQLKLNSDEDSVLIELLLDGFDEVNPTDHALAYKILKTIQESFKSVRVWVTTRPHFLKELENELHVLGHNILPFTEEDQVNFLSSFWSRNNTLDGERTNLFAHHCLRSIKSMMTPGDNDIAGIPVQCLLIGETYEEAALGFSRTDNSSNFAVDIETVTFTNLYRNLIVKRFEKYESLKLTNGINSSDAISVHTYVSLKLIFPEYVSKLSFLSGPTEHELNEVLYMGILESEGATQTPRFIHRTFAEYFVASFVAGRLRRNESHVAEIFDFLFTHVLNCLAYTEEGKKSFKFNHQLICYFLNSLLSDDTTVIAHSYFALQCQSQSFETLQGVAHACSNAD